MKTIYFYLSCVILIFAGYSWYTAQGSLATSNDFVVGISPDYPPYAQIDLQTGKIVGLEVDVVTEIARRLDKNLVIKDMPFNSLIIELLSGQIDAIAAGLTPTPQRKKSVFFSTPYIDNDENIVIYKKIVTPLTSLQDLYDKQVAVCIGYTADSYLSAYPQIDLIRLKSPSDGFMALQTSSVDYFVVAQSIFDNFLQAHAIADNYQTFTLPASADACALAFAKYNKKLQEQIDPAIQDMIKDGTMLGIQKKWGFA